MFNFDEAEKEEIKVRICMDDIKEIIEKLPENERGYCKVIVTKVKNTYSNKYEYTLKIFKETELISSIRSETSIYDNYDIYDYADKVADMIIRKYRSLSKQTILKKNYNTRSCLILVIVGGYMDGR